MLRRVTGLNLRPKCQKRYRYCTFSNLIHVNVNGTCLLQVGEQHVKNDNRTRRAFLTVLKELNIELTPSTRCDFYSRFLRKIYNIRCNEFIRAQKCLEEHHCQQTQDWQVMLREKLKVQAQKLDLMYIITYCYLLLLSSSLLLFKVHLLLDSKVTPVSHMIKSLSNQ